MEAQVVIVAWMVVVGRYLDDRGDAQNSIVIVVWNGGLDIVFFIGNRG